AVAPTGSSRINELLQRFVKATQFNRAVGFALATRTWQILAGGVTLVVVARYFSPELQGFYYTFASLLALQSFVELGFYNVIINSASHEWADLSLDSSWTIVGSPGALSRLVSLGRLVFKWYALASALFIVLVGPAGLAFFGQSRSERIVWAGPWITVVCLT